MPFRHYRETIATKQTLSETVLSKNIKDTPPCLWENVMTSCDGLNSFGAYSLMCLNVWPMANGTIGGLALFKLVWPFWRKCVTVGVSFDVSCFSVSSQWENPPGSLQRKRFLLVSILIQILNSWLLPWHAYLHVAMLPTRIIMDWTF